MDTWQLIISPEVSGATNMNVDLKMFSDFEARLIPSTLRIYSWKPKCISLGYSQDVGGLVDGCSAIKMGWDVVKRPTGGGIVFHNEAEVTYSLVTEIDNPSLPKGLVPSYKKISEAIILALNKVGISAELQTSNFKIQNKSQIPNPNSQLCFSFSAEYEIVVDGRKIVGSAQKRGKRALLQQGSIFVRNENNGVFSVLKNSCAEHDAVSVEEILGKEISFDKLSNALVQGFEERLDIKFII